jgi:hypothetical protein
MNEEKPYDDLAELRRMIACTKKNMNDYADGLYLVDKYIYITQVLLERHGARGKHTLEINWKGCQ